MSSRSLFNERFGMLMACASPGSAWAYHLGSAATKADLVRRSRSTQEATVQADSRKSWLSRGLERVERWSWARQVQADEAYLAQATDLCDLEVRMRRLNGGDGMSRAHALR